jgi:hypothetical protein
MQLISLKGFKIPTQDETPGKKSKFGAGVMKYQTEN